MTVMLLILLQVTVIHSEQTRHNSTNIEKNKKSNEHVDQNITGDRQTNQGYHKDQNLRDRRNKFGAGLQDEMWVNNLVLFL
jgi:hypothetical protein